MVALTVDDDTVVSGETIRNRNELVSFDCQEALSLALLAVVLFGLSGSIAVEAIPESSVVPFAFADFTPDVIAFTFLAPHLSHKGYYLLSSHFGRMDVDSLSDIQVTLVVITPILLFRGRPMLRFLLLPEHLLKPRFIGSVFFLHIALTDELLKGFRKLIKFEIIPKLTRILLELLSRSLVF